MILYGLRSDTQADLPDATPIDGPPLAQIMAQTEGFRNDDRRITGPL